jgi:hypothetical protein
MEETMLYMPESNEGNTSEVKCERQAHLFDSKYLL